ncbi:MAG: hypothetical protein JHC93_00350 [Parachlamydiales bacterium]|nr:hypothetical protein [Parachlamydiales bacterium]
MRLICLVLLALTLSGCGYHFGKGVLCDSYSTVSVPYIDGDTKGDLTTSVIRAIGESGGFQYISSGGDLNLLVKIKSRRTEPIGFTYETNGQGERIGALVSSEDRSSILAEVTVVDCSNNCVLVGPLYFSSSVNYDYQPDTSNLDIAQFSQGQLNYRSSAKESSDTPLYDQLAKKIVSYLNAYW